MYVYTMMTLSLFPLLLALTVVDSQSPPPLRSPAPASPPPLCKDHLPNCSEYQADTCTNSFYRKWAEDHCRKTCGLCVSTTQGAPARSMDNNVLG